jgi:hypothetical protein
LIPDKSSPSAPADGHITRIADVECLSRPHRWHTRLKDSLLQPHRLQATVASMPSVTISCTGTSILTKIRPFHAPTPSGCPSPGTRRRLWTIAAH